MHTSRKQKRKHLFYYLRFLERNSGRLIGHQVDITTEGIKLISKDPIEPHTDFQFALILPETVEGNKQIALDARSIWCKKDVNPDFYAAGFKINNITPKDIRILGSFIEEYAFQR